MNETFTDKADELFLEIHRDFHLESVEAGMEKLENVLRDAEGLTEAEHKYFQEMHLTWTRALDISYHPPHPSHWAEVFPLWLRYKHCTDGQDAEAEKTLWTYVQHCAFGTKAFQDALEMLVSFAVRSKNLKLARHTAEILLHHYALINLLHCDSHMPIGMSEPAEKHEWPNHEWPYGAFDVDLPYWAAIEALREDPAQCWIDILELQLEITPLEDRKEYFYPRVLEALRRHYRKVGDVGRLEWLKVYEPE